MIADPIEVTFFGGPSDGLVQTIRSDQHIVYVEQFIGCDPSIGAVPVTKRYAYQRDPNNHHLYRFVPEVLSE